MEAAAPSTCTAFAGTRRIATGSLREVARQTKNVIDGGEAAPVLIVDDATSRLIEVDFRGSVADVLGRLQDGAPGPAPGEARAPSPRGPGRPKLGVVAREVTLLPRHWDWLAHQPGGASVALRKLVDEARRANEGKDRKRQSQDAAYRFMSAIAGDFAGFEEAARALFAGSAARFDAIVEAWPADVRGHLRRLAAVALGESAAAPAEARAPQA